jgi:hypothetical protein
LTVRLALYAGLLIVLALLGYGLVLWGLAACAPPPLPGDELWSFRHAAGDALGLILRLGSESCFTADGTGAFALWLGTRIAGVLLVALALMVLWEIVGRELRRSWFRTTGGHLLIAGTGDEALRLARAEGRFGGSVFLAPDRASAIELARARPFSETTSIAGKSLSFVLHRMGAARAGLVAATSTSDLTNVAIADAVLAAPGGGEVLLRLEQPAVRALSAHRLSTAAEVSGRPFSLVSLTELQTRRGLIAAMPGRYSIDGDPRIHIAFCGTGSGLEAAVVEIARQGLGLESEPPLFSILRTGNFDFSAATLERLMGSGAAEIRLAAASPGAGGFDAAALSLIHQNPPLRAIHCVAADPAEAEALARRCEDLLASLGLPVPPIVAYTIAGRELGSTGMIRVAAAADLAEAHRLARLREERARAVHGKYLETQRAARGALFGSAPAEVEWKDLPELYREENRAVTDQMEDVKLARAFMLARPGSNGAAMTAAEIEDLAQMAHARWLAARALLGWKHGATRDDRQRLHPDILPYDALTEAAKQKDRDEVASLVTMAGLAGLVLKRERRLAITARLDPAALARLRTHLDALPKDEVPVLVLPFDDDALLPLAETMLNQGIAIEAVLPSGPRPSLAAMLRRAWRIHVAIGRSANAALAERTREGITSEGAIHALA